MKSSEAVQEGEKKGAAQVERFLTDPSRFRLTTFKCSHMLRSERPTTERRTTWRVCLWRSPAEAPGLLTLGVAEEENVAFGVVSGRTRSRTQAA